MKATPVRISLETVSCSHCYLLLHQTEKLTRREVEAKFCNLSLSSSSVSIFQWCDYSSLCNAVIPENAKFSLQSGTVFPSSRCHGNVWNQGKRNQGHDQRMRLHAVFLTPYPSLHTPCQGCAQWSLLPSIPQAARPLWKQILQDRLRPRAPPHRPPPPPGLPAPQSCIIALAFLGNYPLLKSHWQ